jgi:TolA-binding protein
MRCSYYTGDYRETADYAERLINSGTADNSQEVFARYLLAKSYQNMGETTKATEAFKLVDQLDPGEFGAEAKYELCQDAFRKNQLDESENMIYELSESYADYPYWVAKGFILLADIYVQRDNTFQAEQTLQSIIDNYNGDDLKQVARQKLDELKSNGE